MKVVLMEGLGFAEQGHLQTELSLYDIKTQIYDIDQPFGPCFHAEMEGTSIVVFRARWSATAEENLFVRTLVKKHAAYFAALDKLLAEKKISVVAVGRGALLWFEWMRLEGRLGSPIRWHVANFLTNSWIETKVMTRKQTTVAMRALVSGRAFVSRLNLGGASVSAWVEHQDKAVGWLVNDNLYLATVDVFSLSERAQLSDYGYEDLSLVSTRSNLVQMLLTGEM